MENYDQRRRRDEERQQARSEDRGRDRDSWWHERSHDDDRPRRAERGWLDYDHEFDHRDERQGGRDESRSRYAERSGGERSRFSPDWSRQGAQPRYSDDPYYSRNRERSGSEDYSRRSRSESWQGSDDRREWEQRARSSIPREQRELAERGQPGDYYDPDWPYQRGSRDRDEQRANDADERMHYRGYYSRSATPFSYRGGTGYLYSESLTMHGPYAGRGPKGYKRSDQQITEEACQRLERDGEIDASEIEVSAEDGILRLRGTVPDRQTKRRAEECVESVYGARDVMNELRVQREQSQGGQMSQSGQLSSQSSQSGLGSQGSQATQRSQAGGGGGQPQQSGAGRSQSGSSPSEQAPKH